MGPILHGSAIPVTSSGGHTNGKEKPLTRRSERQVMCASTV